MKPKSDASQYYKSLSTTDKQKETTLKYQEAQRAIREKLGMSGDNKSHITNGEIR